MFAILSLVLMVTRCSAGIEESHPCRCLVQDGLMWTLGPVTETVGSPALCRRTKNNK